MKENKCVKMLNYNKTSERFYCTDDINWKCKYFDSSSSRWCKFTSGEYDEYCNHKTAQEEAEVNAKIEEL